ncbi:MAG: sugar phosphate isomerase/epimerase [Prolixibacteraceae bacterium]|nr:sugar phosphate isomerase/epimerase [Prolixibacteraceae bacterium]
MDRREFVKTSLITSAALSAAPAFGISLNNAPVNRNSKIGIMYSTIGAGESVAEKFRLCKEAGFEGIEVLSHMDRDEVVKAREATGMEIPSVCGSQHWKFLLSSPDPDIRRQGREALELSLEDASFYGADTVLLVPGRVDESVSYKECWDRSINEIRRVLPVAEKLNVAIAIENVWNNFILSPVEAVHYLDQFKSPYVKFYFDCGNICVYGWPEQWIDILGSHIARIHIKEFNREVANTNAKREGFNFKLTEGDINWSAVMKSLDNIGYNNYLTLEQRGGDTPEGLKDLVGRAKIIANS